MIMQMDDLGLANMTRSTTMGVRDCRDRESRIASTYVRDDARAKNCSRRRNAKNNKLVLSDRQNGARARAMTVS